MGASRAIAASAPIAAATSEALFWCHHALLLSAPVYIYRRGCAGRFELPRRAFMRYLSFVYPFIGVALCMAALATGRNLNYSLWPPTLPAALLERLGGSYYRVTIGMALGFVVGPFMRFAAIPAVAAVCRLVVVEGCGLSSRTHDHAE